MGRSSTSYFKIKMAPSNTKSNISLREDILRFKLSVKRDKENSLIENSIKDKINSNNANYNDELGLAQEELNNGNSFTNRGNKLLFTSDTVDFTRLNSYRDSLKTESIDEILPSPGHFKRRRLVIVDKNQRLNDIIQKQLDAEFGPVNDEKKKGSNGNTIAVKTPGAHHDNSGDDVDDDDEDDGDYYNDNNGVAISLLKSIDLQSILGPITDPSDIINRKTINSIYQNNHLRNLANETIHIIEKEQDTVNQLSKLMNVFLGDDPVNNLPENLLLPKYDHDLDLFKKFDNIDKIDSKDGEVKEVELKDDKDVQEGKDEDAVVNDDKETDESKSKFDDRRITRSQSITDTKEDGEDGEDDENSNELDATIRQEKYGIIANKLIKDPFFKLPEYVKDFNYGISKNEDAEDSRQLIQIALQRNEEFIRSLSNIRNGFIRADRIKDNILKWCREINDVQNQ
ncbi:hypothetical protein B5S33_g4924 [[Candida] boidinii]|nr:hypothetical protein B5S30_g4248 [[Candida] boidinii]OWB86240.1 hypothetical protein B5S33_g4924 [[Candida] boidinii]